VLLSAAVCLLWSSDPDLFLAAQPDRWGEAFGGRDQTVGDALAAGVAGGPHHPHSTGSNGSESPEGVSRREAANNIGLKKRNWTSSVPAPVAIPFSRTHCVC